VYVGSSGGALARNLNDIEAIDFNALGTPRANRGDRAILTVEIGIAPLHDRAPKPSEIYRKAAGTQGAGDAQDKQASRAGSFQDCMISGFASKPTDTNAGSNTSVIDVIEREDGVKAPSDARSAACTRNGGEVIGSDDY
jgi:hypothetical protein